MRKSTFKKYIMGDKTRKCLPIIVIWVTTLCWASGVYTGFETTAVLMLYGIYHSISKIAERFE